MKKREGFVSNSSSSSFIIKKVNLTEFQIEQIHTHIDSAIKLATDNHEFNNFEYCEDDDAWSVDEREETIFVSTNMDNFDMYEFLKAIGVDKNDMIWRDY